MHGFEFLFVRIAPIIFLTSVVGIVATYTKNKRKLQVQVAKTSKNIVPKNIDRSQKISAFCSSTSVYFSVRNVFENVFDSAIELVANLVECFH